MANAATIAIRPRHCPIAAIRQAYEIAGYRVGVALAGAGLAI
jgi:hypothetical protein